MRNTSKEASEKLSSEAARTRAVHTNPYEQVQPAQYTGNNQQEPVVYPNKFEGSPPPYTATSQPSKEAQAASASQTSDQGKSRAPLV